MIITANLEGTEFYDISDPLNPSHLTNFDIPQGNRSRNNFWAKINGNTAYLSCRNRGLAILDISNPSNPSHLGDVSISGGSNYTWEGMDVQGDTLAVAVHGDGVVLLDIFSPTSPTLLAQIEATNAYTVILKGSVLIIANGEAGLRLVDISGFPGPIVLSTVETEGATKDLVLDGNLLYVAMGSAGVGLYDISDPGNPQHLDTYNTSGLANRIALAGDKLAVSDWLDVKVLSWNGTNLELDGFKSTGYRTMAIGAIDSIIYSAEWRHLQVMETDSIPGSDIDLSTYDFTFPEITIGSSDTMEVTVFNNGNSTLNVSDHIFTNSSFSTTVSLDQISAGDSVIMDVIYTKTSSSASGNLQIYSDDADEPIVSCSVVGNYIGVNMDEVAPDFTLPYATVGTGNFILSDFLGKIVLLAFFAPG